MADSRREGEGRERRVWRAAALGIVALVLAAQVAAIALGTGGRLWPFLRYAMYAQSGSTAFTHRDLCVRTDTGAVSVDHWDLALPRWRFDGLLRGAVAEGNEAETMRALLSRQVKRGVGPHERLEIWSRSYRVGSDGLVDSRPPWELEHAWTAVPADSIEWIGFPDAGEPTRLRTQTCS